MLGNRLSYIVFFVLAAVVFGTVFPYLPLVRNPNENTRTYATMAVVEEHTFNVDAEVARYAYTNDLARVPKPDGTSHLYSVKAPGNTYLGIPVYWALVKLAPKLHLHAHLPTPTSTPVEREDWFAVSTYVLRFVTVQIPCFLFLVWLERWLRLISGDVVLRLAAVAGAGLGTNYLAYSLMFASHTLCAVCAFVAFGLIAKSWLAHEQARFRSAKTALAVGFATGGAVMFEYHALPVAMILAAFAVVVFRRPLQVFALALGGSVHVAGMMFYQWKCFNNPLTPGHKFVESLAFRAQHEKGLYGIELPNLNVFGELSISRAFGFFGTSPFMWLGLLAIPLAFFLGARRQRGRRKLRRMVRLLWLIVLAAFLPVSGFLNWHGGWVVGPRYWSVGPPFFAFAAVLGLENLSVRWPRLRPVLRGTAAGLAIASVIQTGLISITYNTLPEGITRPLAEATIPLLRDGFAPHHLGELLGWPGTRFFYGVVVCLLACAFVPVLTRVEESWTAWIARGVYAVALAAVALVPAFTEPMLFEMDRGTSAVRFLVDAWDPGGRDAIHAARAKLAAGPNVPCEHAELGHMEELVGMFPEARRDEAVDEGLNCGGPRARLDLILEKLALLSGPGAPVFTPRPPPPVLGPLPRLGPK